VKKKYYSKNDPIEEPKPVKEETKKEKPKSNNAYDMLDVDSDESRD
jgi:hypothetical protein